MDASPQVIAALVSATVSLLITIISRWIFSREDRRFPILVLIQEELLKLHKNPPWSTNGGNVYFEKARESAKPLQKYFDRLRMVSFPRRNCAVQKAWKAFANINEAEWKAAHPNRLVNFSDSLSKEEYLEEVSKVLEALK